MNVLDTFYCEYLLKLDLNFQIVQIVILIGKLDLHYCNT